MKTRILLLILSLSLAGPIEASAQDQRLREIVDAPSARRIESDIRTLVGFGTRHTLSITDSDTRGIGAARRWVKSEFDEISAACGGCLQVYFQSDVIGGEKRIPEPTEVVNVIAVLKGQSEPDRYVIMTGDIDSRVSDVMDAVSDAPGANDNASGLAGTLEAARVLTRYRYAASVVFAGLSGEEQGLFGGKIMAAHAKSDGWHIEAVLNNDMIGNIEGINGVIDNSTVRVFSQATRPGETAEEARLRRYTGGEVDSPSRNVARYIDRLADEYMPNLDVMMVYRLDRYGRGGHQKPFNDEGFPAVRVMETNENYHRQHQDVRVENGIRYGDVVEGVNFDFAAKVTGLDALALAAMAWAPAPPANVGIEGMVSPNTTLTWKKVEGAASYRVHWRLTTSPQWTWFRDVGDVDHCTLENVVIDNYIFGVSSVNAEGLESPVVFPGSIGAFWRIDEE